MTWQPRIGAWQDDESTCFRVWAPLANAVTLLVERGDGRAAEWSCTRGERGLFEARLPRLAPGTRYRYRLDDGPPLPDPASRAQPDGVHGASAIVDASTFAWTDGDWHGVSREDLVIYELHVGTFTPDGTFDGVRRRLPYLADLGVTAIELMPVADFPGNRSWGYDGAALFAPARCYGTPDDLRRLVDEAHRHRLAVVLDVVHNHLGPDGAYAFAYSPYYFRHDASTPWGSAVNLDGAHCDEVRAFFIENALHWVHEYHVDGLRLDATHAMRDESPRHFLAELTAAVTSRVSDRRVVVIAEDERNLAQLVRPPEQGGFGLDAVWADDLHHEIRRHLTGETEGYYAAYSGTAVDLATTIERGWFHSGEHSIHAGRPRGTSADDLDYDRFVVCVQNHDQVGNRAHGDRLHHTIDSATWRAACAILLTAPATPLLFMGQEWEAGSPFLFFSDHHPELGRLVTEGRRREFRAFSSFADPASLERIPDPQAVATFEASRLRWDEREREPHAASLADHRTLLRLRREEPALRNRARGATSARAVGEHTIVIRRDAPAAASLLTVACLRGRSAVDLATAALTRAPERARWTIVHSTAPVGVPDAAIVVGDSRSVSRIEFTAPGALVLRSTLVDTGSGEP